MSIGGPEERDRRKHKRAHEGGVVHLGKFIQIYDEKKRESVRKRERTRLRKILGADNDIVTSLIDRAAFLHAELIECEEIIKRDGIIETYKNGENQYGNKKAAAVDVYNNLIKSYNTVIKTLAESRGETSAEQDELLAFMAARR